MYVLKDFIMCAGIIRDWSSVDKVTLENMDT